MTCTTMISAYFAGMSTCIIIFMSVILDCTGLIASYAVGRQNGTIPAYPYIPYISELGDKPPSSSWFTLFLTATTPFLFIFFQRRHAQVAKEDFSQKLTKLNTFAFWVGMASITGKFVVSSFQLTVDKYIHYFGAVTYFGASLLYITIQTFLTYKMGSVQGIVRSRTRANKILTIIRTVLCIGTGVNTAVFIPFSMVDSLAKYNRYSLNIGQGTEWALAICHTCYMLTFMYDFWKITVYSKIIVNERPLDEEAGVDEVDAHTPLLKYT